MAKPVRARPQRTSEHAEVGLKQGFRSGLEETLGQQLADLGVPFRFEEEVLKYVVPERTAKYTPDFVIPHADGRIKRTLVVESKGRFVTADRKKHLLVKAAHPEIDLRFVFSRSAQRISKQSLTTYAMWCEKHGFLYADRTIPHAWLREYGHAI